MPLNRRNLLQISPLALAGLTAGCSGQAPIVGRHRARSLGVRIGTMPPGRFNAITDVDGVTVGHTTLIEGDGDLVVGSGPVRTGVTTIWPHADILDEYLPCGSDAPNGNGEATGLVQAARLGVLGSPICLTNTSSVGMVYDALVERFATGDMPAVEPVVAETWDAFLNDVEGRHVHAEHVYAALDGARGGPVEEGCVGGGTGMICYGFKGGIGTASRRLPSPLDAHVVGVLVQANHGSRELLRIDGVPVGEAIEDLQPQRGATGAMNSIIMVVATDAPLLDYQLDRLARRAVHGLAKTGSISSNSSGDFTVAFSTANRIPQERFWRGDTYTLRSIDQLDIEPLLRATAEATEEAVVNALFMATDMVGRDGNRVWALPLDRTLEVLAAHGRLFPPPGDAAGD